MVRSIAAIVIGVVGLGWIASSIEVAQDAHGDFKPVSTWRFTTNGWEKLHEMAGLKEPRGAVTEIWKTHPHPLITAALVGLFSTFLLVAFSPAQKAATRRGKPTSHAAAGPEIELRSRAWLSDTQSP